MDILIVLRVFYCDFSLFVCQGPVVSVIAIVLCFCTHIACDLMLELVKNYNLSMYLKILMRIIFIVDANNSWDRKNASMKQTVLNYVVDPLNVNFFFIHASFFRTQKWIHWALLLSNDKSRNHFDVLQERNKSICNSSPQPPNVIHFTVVEQLRIILFEFEFH